MPSRHGMLLPLSRAPNKPFVMSSSLVPVCPASLLVIMISMIPTIGQLPAGYQHHPHRAHALCACVQTFDRHLQCLPCASALNILCRSLTMAVQPRAGCSTYCRRHG